MLQLRTFIFLLITCCPVILYAQGNIDPTFGAGGKVILNYGELDYIADMDTIQGSYIIAGSTADYNNGYNFDYVISKISSSGNADNSFGLNGVIRGDFPGYTNSYISKIACTDDFIYLIGAGYVTGLFADQQVFVCRYLSNGTLDSAFGDSGYYTRHFLSNHDIPGEIQIDGDRLVFTLNSLDTNYAHMEIPVFGALDLSTGLPDSTFGQTGIISWSPLSGAGSLFHTGKDRHADGAVLSNISVFDSAYFFSSHYFLGEGHICFSAMFDKGGELMTDYGQNGLLTYDLNFGMNNRILKVLAWKDSLAMLCEVFEYDDEQDFVVQMVSKAGAMGTRYNLDLAGRDDVPKDMTLTSEQVLLITGYSRQLTNNSAGYDSDYFTVIALDTSGSVLSNFATNGVFEHQLVPNDESGSQLLLLDGTQLLIAGYSNTLDSTGYTDISLIRLDAVTNSILNSEESVSLYVFPNPCTNNLYISSDKKIISYEIISIEGKRVLTSPAWGTKEVSTDDLPPGHYFIKFQLENQQQTVRPFTKSR